MRIEVRFRDGSTGGLLTTEHSQSSYGLPVFTPNDYTRDYMKEDAYGAGDLAEDAPFVLLETPTDDELARIRSAGFKLAIDCKKDGCPEDLP